MGNPQILPSHTGEPAEPPLVRVLWMVYHLRDQGEKLTRPDVLRTGRMGQLVLHQQDDGLAARLVDLSGYPTLDSLHQVKVIRNDSNGLLLHGTILSVKSGLTRELPQAWWCVVASAEPVLKDAPGQVAEG